MDPTVDPTSEPVFWWWQEESGARVVVLTDSLLVLSEPLTREGLIEVEEARQDGNVLAAEFGNRALRVPLGAVSNLRFVPDEARVLVDLDDGRTTCAIEPPLESSGVAAGVFDVLSKRLAPDVEPRDSAGGHGILGFTHASIVQVMAAIGGVGILFLGLAAWASDDAARSAAASPINDLFAALGYVPAGLCFAAVLGLQVYRMRSDEAGSPDEKATRVIEVTTADLAEGTDSQRAGESLISGPAPTLYDEDEHDDDFINVAGAVDPLRDLLDRPHGDQADSAPDMGHEPFVEPLIEEPAGIPVPPAPPESGPAFDIETEPEETPERVVQPEPVPAFDIEPEPEETPERVVQPEPVPGFQIEREETPERVVQPEPV
ncbi:MAG: hypothetical protein ACR2PK_16840, partial [Acidimicrobiales bacterium]